jgi:hypothetical protein
MSAACSGLQPVTLGRTAFQQHTKKDREIALKPTQGRQRNETPSQLHTTVETNRLTRSSMSMFIFVAVVIVGHGLAQVDDGQLHKNECLHHGDERTKQHGQHRQKNL